jgi:EmrB/QacA subfamily drug resistance transporter
MSHTLTSEADPTVGRRPQRALSAVMIGAFIALLDTTIINVALPSIQHALHASPSMLEWTVSGYALAFGLVLIPAGRLGDAIGRRPLYLGGLALFLLASLGAGLSQNPTELVIARVLQGVAAGVYYPQINATIVDTFAGPKRSKAFGVLAAIIGLSTAVGPLAGGLLISAAGTGTGWRWIFLINLVIGVVAIPAAVRWLPTPVRHGRPQADLGGISLITFALLLILVPLIEGQTLDWPIWTYVCLAAAPIAFIGLAYWERHVQAQGRIPLIPPRLIARPTFASGAALALLYFASFTSIFFSLAVTWQEGFAHAALASGLVVSPFAVGAILTARKSQTFSQRLGPRVLAVGTGIVALGLISLLFVFHASQVPQGWYLIAPLLVTGLGHGLIVAPNMDIALASVPRADNGAASGVLNTAQRVGSALGIALVGTVLFGTLHPHGNSAHNLAAAFSHSVQLALLVNIGLILATFALSLFIGRQAD